MPTTATVLVVEDDLSTLGLLSAVAQHYGLATRTAENGRIALDMIAEAPPDAIILDLIMPELDGFEVLRRMKRDAPELLGRTIVLTAAAIRDADLHDLALARELMYKPLDIEQLGEALIRCVYDSKEIGRDGAYETPPRP